VHCAVALEAEPGAVGWAEDDGALGEAVVAGVGEVVVHGVVDAGDRAGWQCSSFIYQRSASALCQEGRRGEYRRRRRTDGAAPSIYGSQEIGGGVGRGEDGSGLRRLVTYVDGRAKPDDLDLLQLAL
jgi:hypothetical protein